ncbi:MAG: hypothetical protein EVA65_16490 [Oceanococcus sp.]|nr:MAG: hypothetical protein EVA65_16490 [Oceanococcus sp.]
MTNYELLEKALENRSLRELETAIGVNHVQIQQSHSRKIGITPAMAAKLAELLGEDPIQAVMEAEEAKARKAGDRELFGRLKKKAALMAATSVLLVGVSAPQNQRILIDSPYHSAYQIKQYILC